MGTDIHGVVEINFHPDLKGNRWYDVIDAGMILIRSYDMFGMLFGVGNITGLTPVAQWRGIPEDCCDTVREQHDDPNSEYHSWTYVTYEEIKSIGLDEESPEYDPSLHEFKKADDGSWQDTGRTSYACAEIDWEKVGHTTEYVEGDTMHKKVRLRRRDCLGSDWALLVRLMDVLAEYYGAKNVRLVVWFDN